MTVHNTKPALPIISDNVEQQAKAAFQTLHSLFSTHGSTVMPTDFADLGLDGYEKLATRAIGAIKAARMARREAAIAGIRASIKGTVEAAVQSHKVQKEAYDTLLSSTPEAMRKFIAAFPTSVQVPMSDIDGAFPEGTKLETKVALLKEMSYPVSKGKDNSFNLVIPVPFSSKS